MRSSAILRSDGILLRTIESSDSLSDYLLWLNDAEITKFLEVRLNPPQTETELRDFIASSNRSKDAILFGIFLEGEERLIGTVKLSSLSKFHERAEIGILIGARDSRRSGKASTAIRLAVNHALSELSLKTIYAGYYSDHVASRKLFASLGFRVIATIPQYFRVENGSRQDHEIVVFGGVGNG